MNNCRVCGAGGADPHGIERLATPEEIESGWELGIMFDDCPLDPAVQVRGLMGKE